MGWGNWSSSTYDRVTTRKLSSGTSFGYTRTAKRSGNYEAHDSLKVLVDGKPVTRESRDSDEHPKSTPIIVGFDVTGSMGENPDILQRSLKGLFGMLVRKNVVSDPQVAIGAYGDTHCDRVPVQLSQFESDNRIDDNLDNVFIEGCGGGNSVGFTRERVHLFLATDLEPSEQDLDPGEFINVDMVPIGEVRDAIRSGELVDGKTIVGTLMTMDAVSGEAI